MFLEHKELWNSQGTVDPDAEPLEIGVAHLLEQGTDITIVSCSSTVHACIQAHSELVKLGISADIIDLRTRWPWDQSMVEKSFKKTGRLLISYESIRTMGFDAEIIAEITEKYFDLFRSPPSRVASPRIPVPYSKPLEDICRVGSEKIVQSVLNILK